MVHEVAWLFETLYKIVVPVSILLQKKGMEQPYKK